MNLRETIIRALEEDIGSGDVTSEGLLTGGESGSARAYAKSDLVMAGIDVFGRVFRTMDKTLQVEPLVNDGNHVKAGDDIARVSGSLKNILAAERVALNFLQRMCGIATMTNRFVKAVEGTEVRILDTRKTAPGLRFLDKYAVRVGGGMNHRFGLDRGVLIKDNHIAAAGGIREAVGRIRKCAPPAFTIEVEVRTFVEVEEALDCNVDIIMLDNMTRSEQMEAVRRIGGKALVEASGNVTLDTVADIAATGVDFISVGSLTHSVIAADISMVIEKES